MKRKPNNPRQISKREFERLAADLERFGDLGGVVHNETTGNFVGGNQRSSVFELERQGAQITVTETYAEPTRTGTVARGYVEWRGERYDYRRVRWDTETEDAACLVANLRGGTWDFDALSAWDGDILKGFGFDGDLLAAWNDQAANLRELLESEIAEDEIPEERIEIKPREMARVLVSVPVDRALDVRDILNQLNDIDGIEIIYGAN